MDEPGGAEEGIAQTAFEIADCPDERVSIVGLREMYCVRGGHLCTRRALTERALMVYTAIAGIAPLARGACSIAELRHVEMVSSQLMHRISGLDQRDNACHCTLQRGEPQQQDK